MNSFRKWFLAFRKVSSGKKIINNFLMNHQVFDESSSFCWKIYAFLCGLYRTFMIHQVFDESLSFCWQSRYKWEGLKTGTLAKGLRYWYANCLQSWNVWIHLMYEFTCMNWFERILGRNKHFRKESHSPEAIASGRNVVLRKRFWSNQTTLKIAHFNKIINNRKWILHLHLYDRGYNNASNLRWSDGVFTSDRTKTTGRVLASLPTLCYWSCKITLIISFWFWIFFGFFVFRTRTTRTNNQAQQMDAVHQTTHGSTRMTGCYGGWGQGDGCGRSDGRSGPGR